MKKSLTLYKLLLILCFIISSAINTIAQTLATPEETAGGLRITSEVIERSIARRDSIKNNSIEELELPEEEEETEGYIISGPTMVSRNSIQSYFVRPYGENDMYWYVSGEAVVLDYYDELIQVKFDGEDSVYFIKLFSKDDVLLAEYVVHIYTNSDNFSPGELITGDQSFLSNQSYSHIDVSEPSGGNCNGNYQYLWQRSYDREIFENINGSTSESLNLSSFVTDMIEHEILTQFFRRRVVCGIDTLFSGIAGVTILPDLQAGVINSTIRYYTIGQSNESIKPEPATGGNCLQNYSYQWQYSYNNTTFTNITGATNDSLIIDNSLDQNIYFRRRVQCGEQVAFTNSVQVMLTEPTLRPLAANTGNQSPVINARKLPPSYASQPISFLRVLAPTIPIQDSAAVNITLPAEHLAVSTTYQDSYGRAIQSVTRQQSPDKKDLVSAATFDAFGRPVVQYMPFVAVSGNRDDGGFKQNAFEQDSIFYRQLFPHEKVIYAEKQYDESPLNIPVRELAPGNSWGGSGRGVEYFFRANDHEDSVRRWTIAINNENDVPQSTGYYQPGILQVTSVKDESRNWVMKYTDDQGRTVMTKTLLRNRIKYGAKGWLVTYYVYDEMGLLRAVIPPKASELLCSSAANWNVNYLNTFENLCFAYFYDDWGRAIMKRIPGKGKTYIAYDLLGRVVMTQDAKLRTTQQWAFVKYDNMSRPVKSGLITSSLTKDQIISQASASNDYPSLSGDFTVTSETFYDNYDWISAQSAPFASTIDSSDVTSERFITTYNTSPDYAQPVRSSKRIRGMATGTKTRILHSNTFLFAVNYYDRNGRSVQTQQTNITGGKDVSTVQYAYSGLVLRTHLRHQKQGNNSKEYSNLTKYEYDHAGRLMKLTKNFNSLGDKVITTNSYNELGMLTQKKLGDEMEKQEFDFNIRGWITGINKDFVTSSSAPLPGTIGARYFGEMISYDSGYARALYNGNISGIRWKAVGDRIARSYGFRYDNAGRLMYADFSQQNEGSTAWTKDKVDYTVSGLDYDANGNILSMSQRALKIGASAIVDSLRYEYFSNSNLLRKVTDLVADQTPGHFKDTSITADDYAYDVGGNIVKDNNRRMHQSGGGNGAVYNILDKPDSIVIADKSTTRYEYDAAGNLLRKKISVQEGGQTVQKEYVYVAGFVYLNDTLQYSLMEEGCVRRVMRRSFQTGEMYEAFDYQYYVKDRQGNIRAVLTEGKDTSFYQATMEPANETLENALFSNVYNPINTVNNKPAGFDQEAENTKVSRLNASPGTNKKTGPSLVLKVMAGDRVQINTWSFYNTAAQQPSSGTNLATELLSILPGAIIGNSGGKLEAANISSVGGALSPNLLQFLNGNRPYDNNRPRAYLNWILFDEQFNYVSSNSGVMQVQPGTEKQPLVAPEQLVSKNGYLFVYVSNESPQDVYFDDLTVRHITGPLVEEKSYYPFGLVMGAISSRAVLKAKTAYAYNVGSEWEENGVEYYHTFFRKYDAQIGRFTGVDILSEKYLNYSPYQYSENNPILISDPTGAASDFVNPAQFKDAKSLINYVMENGINSFEHQFTRWLFFGSLDSSPANGGGGTFSDMQIQFGDIMERGSKKNGQTGFWINVSGFRYDRNEDKDENGNNVITLNTVMVGRVFISDQTLWSTAMEWGETHRDAYFHFMGSVEKFDAMFDKNYSLYVDRLAKGAPLSQPGDRNSYSESLNKFAAKHARYLDGKRFEATIVGIFAAPLVVSTALEAGVVSGAIGLYESATTTLSAASLDAGILVNFGKNCVVNGFVNELGLYTSSGIVGTIGRMGYEYTVTGGNVASALYLTGGLFSPLPPFGRIYIPILPH